MTAAFHWSNIAFGCGSNEFRADDNSAGLPFHIRRWPRRLIRCEDARVLLYGDHRNQLFFAAEETFNATQSLPTFIDSFLPEHQESSQTKKVIKQEKFRTRKFVDKEVS